MCGLAGCHGIEWDVDAALDIIRHRGPDGRGTACEGGAVHGHVRLAILDPEPRSDQPFRHAGGGLLSYNGELWNWQELRSELESSGHVFETDGDTEVLAAALAEWGADALPRLDGQFAFAWTERGGDTLLARDRMGETPFYYVRFMGGILWASERKALGLDHGVPAAMPAAHAMWTEDPQPWPWWEPSRPARPDAQDVLPFFERAVNKRVVTSDVPVAALCSGGLDSSAVAVCAQRLMKLTCYVAALDGDSLDLRHARELAAERGLDLREVQVEEPTVENVEEAIWTAETSLKTQTEIALVVMPLAKAVARDGHKVVVTGDGADELFGGYGNMMIKGSRLNEDGWRELKLAALAKMARSDLHRANKCFMASAVESRAPFLDADMVELSLWLDRSASPPGKRLLKAELGGLVGSRIAKRPKQTFQGGSGMSEACARLFDKPAVRYREIARRMFGVVV